MKTTIESASKTTPEIYYSASERLFMISGVSTPINAFEYYQKIIEWLNVNDSNIDDQTEFKFHLPYFNSASMKALLMLLERIKSGITSGKTWTITWLVEEEDEFMQDAADSFQQILELKFKIIS
jgi:SiaC family regulatory phosphoprotein